MTPRFLFLLFVVFTALSCNDDIEGLFPDPLDPFQKTFKSSLFIEVKDTSGTPVRDALIQIGNVNGKTDYYGFLFLENVPVGNTSYLTAEKDGYFIGSRRFYPSEGQSSYIRIILISNQRIAFFTSSAGANLSIGSGVMFTFPKDAYELENGNAYNGEIFVSAIAIKADDPDLSFKMPGDLVGLNQNNEKGALASLGMVAVELKNSSGDLLRIKEGATVGIRMEIPVSMLDVALPTLPMWHFDETKGIWKEEGYATLVENAYLTEVSHFSFWNFDAWFEIIKWGTTLLYDNNAPAGQTRVCITIPSLNATKCDYTNEEGVICGMVAANEVLEMEVISLCNEVMYSTQIGPFADSIRLPPVIISTPKQITINGFAVSCEDHPVEKGYAIITHNDNTYFNSLDPLTGSFSTTLVNCFEGEVNVTIIDTEANTHSIRKIFNYAPFIEAGTIEVCQELNEYLVLNVEGLAEEISFDSLNFRITIDGYSLLYSYRVDTINSKFINFSFIGSSAGFYPDVSSEIGITLETGERLFAQNIDLQITYFGEIGDYVQGYLSGVFYLGQASSYPFTGKFSVLRK